MGAVKGSVMMIFLYLSSHNWLSMIQRLAFSRGPGGLEHVQGPGSMDFQLFWDVSRSIVPNYDENMWERMLLSVYGIKLI